MSDTKELRRLLTASGLWPELADAECDDGEHASYGCPSCNGEGRIEGELVKGVHYGSLGIQIYGIGEQMQAMERLHYLLFTGGMMAKLLDQAESKAVTTIKKVYLLMGRYHNDEDVVLAVYVSRESTDREKDKCEVHKSTEPRSTLIEDDPDGEKLWAAHDAWSEGLPYGENYDVYSVEERELLP